MQAVQGAGGAAPQCTRWRAAAGAVSGTPVRAYPHLVPTRGRCLRTPTRAAAGAVDVDIETPLWDAVVIGSGMGGLTAGTQMAVRGAKVLVLEKYIVPGGSAAYFEREGYRFNVGSSMMFGFGDSGNTNLLTRALAAVGKRIPTVPDPSQLVYHLPRSDRHPGGLTVRVARDYATFLAELQSRFPHESAGIAAFYAECWAVFGALNALELKSLEEPRYLLEQFAKHPLLCLQLAAYAPQNAGDVARKHVSDPELLRFIDMECFCWSTVDAGSTPMINAGMVFCDRHYNGINQPVGGVSTICEAMAQGLTEAGGAMVYRANVRRITTEDTPDGGRRATGVELLDGRVVRAKAVVSNATRWDTFERLLPPTAVPPDEAAWASRFTKSPSFLSIHLGVRAEAIPKGCDVHHMLLESWSEIEATHGTLWLSIPTLLDPSLAPPGRHVVHIFARDWIDGYEGLPPAEYEAKKEAAADAIVTRWEAIFPGLRAATAFRAVASPRTHRKFLGRDSGSYGPVPSRPPLGMLSMPMARTGVPGLYCVGDSTFPGQGVNAVAFSGVAAAHRLMADQGRIPTLPGIDEAYNAFLRLLRRL